VDNTLIRSENAVIQEPIVIDESSYKIKVRAEIALNSISDAVICTDIDCNIDYMNIAAEKITGWPRDEAFGKPVNRIFNIINGITRKPAFDPVGLVLQIDKPRVLAPNTVLIKRDGTEVEIEDSTSPIHDEKEKLTGVVIVFHDVSATKAMAKKMEHAAQHDFLTTLPNRMLLNDRIEQAIAFASRHHTQLAVLFLDLDNFKHINDSLGHAAGDKLLQSVAKRLQHCVRVSDTVSRQGGDEFVILLAESKNEDAALTAQKILVDLLALHEIDKNQLHITTSIGISVYPADGTDAETLLKSADTAMYCAKEKGRNNYQFFTAQMNTRATERLVIENNLRLALNHQQFILHYQPIVNLTTGKITGAEALLRWQNSELSEVSPETFLPVAIDSGLMVPIGRWVLRQACKQAKAWQDKGLPAISIAINISAQEFLHKDFVEDVKAVLVETRLAAEYLELEFTEPVLMRDTDCSTQILQQLKEMGVKLAVEDFGTGCSSLSHLQRFPIDVLKIDQSFVQSIKSAKDDGFIVSAIISMGNSLKLKVIAEGIETTHQLDFLTARQCEEGQGHFYSRPIDAESFTLLLSKNHILVANNQLMDILV
jgi:diguanylate cyclase (GGDEF)-like protein/PAS domain S-box-containing protein